MGYHLTTSLDLPATRPHASPKTHVPGSRLQERGHRFYSPEEGRWLGRDPDDDQAVNPYSYSLPDAEDSLHPATEVVETVLGSTSCDLTKKVGDPMDVVNSDKMCSKPCTQQHEDQHVSDLSPCCDKARAAYQKKGANKKQVQKDWDKYVKQAKPWTECNAYKKSVECAKGLLKDWKCDCATPVTNLADCNCMRTYKNSSASQVTKYCGQKGADKAATCPWK